MRTMAELQGMVFDYCEREQRKSGTEWPKVYMTFAGTVVAAHDRDEMEYHRRMDWLGLKIALIGAPIASALLIWAVTALIK